jgi:hypothetical protein
MLGATILLALLYVALNIFVTYQRAKTLHPLTIREDGDTVIITEGGQELNPSTYQQLDQRFNIPTDNISLRKVIIAAIGFAVIGIILALLSAYII